MEINISINKIIFPQRLLFDCKKYDKFFLKIDMK